MAFVEPVIFGEPTVKPLERQISRPCQSADRLSILSSHLQRRADIALIGLAVMVSRTVVDCRVC